MTSRKLARIAIKKGATQKITKLSPFGETVLDRINKVNKIFIFYFFSYPEHLDANLR